MPGEIGNETESQSVGYGEHRYRQTGEWMDDERLEPKDDTNKRKTQKERILKKMKEKYYQGEIDHSSIPGNGGIEDLGNTRK
jgi:hypothetical protein